MSGEVTWHLELHALITSFGTSDGSGKVTSFVAIGGLVGVSGDVVDEAEVFRLVRIHEVVAIQRLFWNKTRS